MVNKKQIFIFACLGFGLFWVLSQAISSADDNPYTRVSLKGINGVQVKISISRTLEQLGLKKEDMQLEVESILKTAGIKLLNETERTNAPGRPLFEVRITGSKLSKPSIYLYDINFFVFQDVILKREPSAILSAATWSKKISGNSGSLEDIAGLTKTGIEMFLRSYGSVNPK